MLRDSVVVVVVVVVVVRTRPRAIPLAMITIRKSFMGFLFFPVMTMGLRLAALRAAGAPLLICKLDTLVFSTTCAHSQLKKKEKKILNTLFVFFYWR